MREVRSGQVSVKSSIVESSIPVTNRCQSLEDEVQEIPDCCVNDDIPVNQDNKEGSNIKSIIKRKVTF